MKASEVISQLTALIEQHGDLDCRDADDVGVTTIEFNDDLSDGNSDGPGSPQPPVFIIG